MDSNFRETWETYTSSWKAESPEEKQRIFGKCLEPNCEYNDPLIKTKGWDELLGYMLEFHKQIPGGHFTTKYFLAHSNKSIARWDMLGGDGSVLGEGISFGQYSPQGKLISMTGFFEVPGA